MNEQTKPAIRPMSSAGHGLHKAGGRGDGNQAGDGAGDGAQRRGLAVVNPLEDRPADGRGGGGEVGVDEGAMVASELAARAEPALKPNQPTQSRQAPMKLRTRLCGGILVCG